MRIKRINPACFRKLSVLFFLAVAAISWAAFAGPEILPDFSATDVRGTVFRLSSQTAGATLLGFLQTVPDTQNTSSKQQAVILESMDQQYRPAGLRVVIIDASVIAGQQTPGSDTLVNASYDWHLRIPLLEDHSGRLRAIAHIESVPAILLLTSDRRVRKRWQGLTHAPILAESIEALLGGMHFRTPANKAR